MTTTYKENTKRMKIHLHEEIVIQIYPTEEKSKKKRANHVEKARWVNENLSQNYWSIVSSSCIPSFVCDLYTTNQAHSTQAKW